MITELSKQELAKRREAQKIIDEAFYIARYETIKACRITLLEFELLVGNKNYNKKTRTTLAVILLTRAIIDLHKNEG